MTQEITPVIWSPKAANGYYQHPDGTNKPKSMGAFVIDHELYEYKWRCKK